MMTANGQPKATRIPRDLPLEGTPQVVAPPDPDGERLEAIDARLAEIGPVGPVGTQAAARELNEAWQVKRKELIAGTAALLKAERAAFHAWRRAADQAAATEAEAARLVKERKGLAMRASNRERAMEAAAA